MARIEAGIDEQQLAQADAEKRGRRRQYERQRDLCGDERAAKPRRAGGVGRRRRPQAIRRGIDPPHRRKARCQPRSRRRADREQDNRRIESNRVEPRQIGGRLERLHEPSGEQQPGASAGGRQEQAFDRDLPEQPRASRAERRAQGEIAPPRRQLAEGQADEVHARDQEHQRRTGKGQQDDRRLGGDDLLVQRHDPERAIAIGVGILPRQVRSDDVQRALRLFGGDAVAQLHDRLVGRDGAVVREAAGGVEGHPEVDVLDQESSAGRRLADRQLEVEAGENADDGVGLPADVDRAADRRGVAVKHHAPDPMAEQRHTAACVLRTDQPSEHDVCAQERQQIGLGFDEGDAIDPLSAAADHQRPAAARQRRRRRERPDAAEILEIGVAQLLAPALHLLPHGGKPVGVRIRQGASEHSIRDAERRARCADTDRQEHGGQRRRKGTPAELPPAIAHVEAERLEGTEGVHLVDRLANPRRVAQLAARRVARVAGRHPSRDVLVGLDRQIRVELAGALVVPPAASEETSQAQHLDLVIGKSGNRVIDCGIGGSISNQLPDYPITRLPDSVITPSPVSESGSRRGQSHPIGSSAR